MEHNVNFVLLCYSFQNTSHTNERVAVLMCRELGNLPKPVNMAKPRSSVIVPYICEQGSEIHLSHSEL